MSSFLSGIGRAIRAPGFGDRLQAALAAAQGDTNAIMRLRALQQQQAELQRQNDARDAQVIGAKNMGFGNDEIGAMSPQDLSQAARQLAALRAFGSGAGAAGGGGDDALSPNPAGQPGPLSGPGPFTQGAVMAPQAGAPYGGFGPDQFSSGPFGPTYFSGGEPGGDQPQGRSPNQAAPSGYVQPRFASDQNGPPLDRKAAVQQAAAAIQGGADPKAVRARLNQIGRDDANFDPSDPFSDLLPADRQAAGAIYPSDVARQEMLPADQPLFARDSISGRYDLNRGAAAEASGGGAPASFDRASAIQYAADAIQRGADPDAVRARLHEMGHTDLDPPSPFSDLIPPAGQAPGMIGVPSAAMPVERPTTQDQRGLERSSYPAVSPQQYRGNLQLRSDPSVGPQKADDSFKHFQLKTGSQLRDPASALGRGIPALVAGAPGIVVGGDTKPPRPRGLPNNVIVSSPRTGGPRDRLPPRHSYSVQPYHLGGGLNGNGYTPQNEDAQLLARAIYAESGITPEDMPAIGWAIVNRVGFRNGSQHPSYGATLSEVVHQRLRNGHYAYSFLDDGGSAAWRRSANPSTIPDPAVWAQAVAAANRILSGRIPDPTGGAQHYFSSSEYDPLTRQHAKGDFEAMLRESHYIPSPYQSRSTATDDGRPHRNYLFIENPFKLWDPPQARPGRR